MVKVCRMVNFHLGDITTLKVFDNIIFEYVCNFTALEVFDYIIFKFMCGDQREDVSDYICIFYRLFKTLRTCFINKNKVCRVVNFRLRNFTAPKVFNYIIFKYVCGDQCKDFFDYFSF